ncbi:MAG: hypothetical protein ACREBJ_04610 [Nitrosotalea sp.]
MPKKSTAYLLKQQDINIKALSNDAELKEKIENHIADDSDRFVRTEKNFDIISKQMYITIALVVMSIIASPTLVPVFTEGVKFLFTIV